MSIGVLSTALTVARKELRTSFRDRQTVLYTVLLPLAMYPTLFWILLQGLSFIQGRDQLSDVNVTVAGLPAGVSAQDLEQALLAEPDASGASGAPGTAEAPAKPGDTEDGQTDDADREAGAVRVHFEPAMDLDEIRELLAMERSGADGPETPRPDAVLAFPADASEPRLYFSSTQSRSQIARERVAARMVAFQEAVREQAALERDTSLEELAPFRVEANDLASERDLGGFLLSLVLPMTFLVMAVMGAFFPAVDLTAGEKERGTAETTLLLPTARLGVHLGKILAVTVAATIATSLNLVGMALAAEHLLAGMPGRDLVIEIPWSSIVGLAPFALTFLFFASALLVAAASLTDSFKQGQSLLGVVQMLFLVPGLVAIMPGIELNLGLAFVPIVQTVLAFKGVLQPDTTEVGPRTLHFAVVLVTQIVYAWLAIVVSLRLAERESLFFKGSSLRALPRLLRGNPKRHGSFPPEDGGSTR